jgi:hypothetical protein
LWRTLSSAESRNEVSTWHLSWWLSNTNYWGGHCLLQSLEMRSQPDTYSDILGIYQLSWLTLFSAESRNEVSTWQYPCDLVIQIIVISWHCLLQSLEMRSQPDTYPFDLVIQIIVISWHCLLQCLERMWVSTCHLSWWLTYLSNYCGWQLSSTESRNVVSTNPLTTHILVVMYSIVADIVFWRVYCRNTVPTWHLS